jgi:hypothetical protein
MEKSPLQFLLSPVEQPLIAAAITLADWLLAQRETTRQQRNVIQRAQQALRGLPTVPAGVAAEYGFHARLLSDESLLYRAWRVSLSQAGLEIYSVYTPDTPIDLRDKMANELNFWIRPGETSGHDGHYRDAWIEEVRDPARFRAGALEFQVYATVFD